MANRSIKLGAFHGGINDNTDARDIGEEEIAEGVDVAVNHVGRLGVIGGVGGVVHSSLTSADIEPLKGSGIFYYSTDRDKAGLENSEDWLVIYDKDGKVHYFCRAKGGGTPSLDTNRQNVWLEHTEKDKAQPNFFLADGILRYSDGNYDKASPNQVSQYVDNLLFSRSTSQSSYDVSSVRVLNEPSLTAGSGENYSSIVSGMTITGTGIPENTVVQSVDTSADPDTLTMTNGASAAGTSDLTFSLNNIVTRQAWVTGSQELKSFSELGKTLTLNDSQAEGPDDSELGNGLGNLVLSYWTGEGEDNGNWNGSFEYAASPMYHQGGVGPITMFDGVTNFHNDLVAFQLHITLTNSISATTHPFGDDRINGVRVWFRSHGADKWHKLKDFEMKKGGKHRWEVYDGATNKAYGIFNGSISNPVLTATDTDPDPDIVESYKETTMSFTITNSASGFTGRKGFIRVWGVYNEPQWLNTFNGNAIDLGATSQAYTMTVTTPAVGTREFRVELLDESFNVLVKSAKTDILITDTGATPPPNYNDNTDSS